MDETAPLLSSQIIDNYITTSKKHTNSNNNDDNDQVNNGLTIQVPPHHHHHHHPHHDHHHHGHPHHRGDHHHSHHHHHHHHHKKPKTNTVKTGYLKMRHTTLGVFSFWRTYYFTLKKSVLVYKNHKEDKRIAGIINLSKVSIWSACEETGKDTAFMVYHPLRDNVLFLASSTDSMKSWMSAMQSVKDYLALYDKEEDYTSSDEEVVNCCGVANVRLPWLFGGRRQNRLPPQIFDDAINQSLLGHPQHEASTITPTSARSTITMTENYASATSVTATVTTPPLLVNNNSNCATVSLAENNTTTAKTTTTTVHGLKQHEPSCIKVICTCDPSANMSSDAEIVSLDLTDEEKVQMIEDQVQKLVQHLSKELHVGVNVQFQNTIPVSSSSSSIATATTTTATAATTATTTTEAPNYTEQEPQEQNSS